MGLARSHTANQGRLWPLSCVLALACALAFTAAAYASTDSTYATWTSAAPNDAMPTPHKGYAMNTNKCAVCHAVHKARTTGQVLLPTRVSLACVYCHIDTATGGITLIYAAQSSVYYAFSNAFAHQRTGESECVDCHSVHGADTIDGPNAAKILRDWSKDGAFRSYSTFALAKWSNPATVTDDDEQITAWCTGCHKYFVESYETTVNYLRYNHLTFVYEWSQAKSHIMTDLAGGYGNTAATIATGTQVAYAPSMVCRSCHDAGLTDAGPGVVTQSFPHYTPTYWRFMKVGESMAASGSQNSTGTVDGLCLKCHRLTATTGVGLTF